MGGIRYDKGPFGQRTHLIQVDDLPTRQQVVHTKKELARVGALADLLGELVLGQKSEKKS